MNNTTTELTEIVYETISHFIVNSHSRWTLTVPRNLWRPSMRPTVTGNLLELPEIGMSTGTK